MKLQKIFHDDNMDSKLSPVTLQINTLMEVRSVAVVGHKREFCD